MFQTDDKPLSTEILSKLEVTIGPESGRWVSLIVFHSHDNVQLCEIEGQWSTILAGLISDESQEMVVVLVYRGSYYFSHHII